MYHGVARDDLSCIQVKSTDGLRSLCLRQYINIPFECHITHLVSRMRLPSMDDKLKRSQPKSSAATAVLTIVSAWGLPWRRKHNLPHQISLRHKKRGIWRISSSYYFFETAVVPMMLKFLWYYWLPVPTRGSISANSTWSQPGDLSLRHHIHAVK